MQTSACDISEQAMIERYLARKLSPPELEQFESHMVMCDSCQQSVQLGAVIRRSFRNMPARTSPVLKPQKRWRHWHSAISGIAAAVAVVIITSMWRTEHSSRGELERLGLVRQSPLYLGIAVRAHDDTNGETLFDSAMRAYGAERYADAIVALRSALAAGVAEPPLHFFLGASLLATGAIRNATAEFTSVISAGDTPYRAEALYYRAKCHLQLRETANALADLEAAGISQNEIGAQARALRDSVTRTTLR